MAKHFRVKPDGSLDHTKFIELHDFAYHSMCIDLYFEAEYLASGTNFFVNTNKGPLLITNRHNFTGRHHDDGTPLDKKYSAVPNNAEFFIHKHGSRYRFNLYKDEAMNSPVWIEHPVHGAKADIAAVLFSDLNTENITGIDLFHDPSENWKSWSVTDRVHVVGYPYRSIAKSQTAVWATGYIATEPALSYGDYPYAFLIDCRSRPGQSGSPVLAQIKAGESTLHNGELHQAKKNHTFFLGVYSGRINKDSDLGIVWQKQLIREIVAHVETDESIKSVSSATNRGSHPSKFLLSDIR